MAQLRVHLLYVLFMNLQHFWTQGYGSINKIWGKMRTVRVLAAKADVSYSKTFLKQKIFPRLN